MGIELRNLEEKDAPGMLEWMTDSEISQYFKFPREGLSIEKAVEFIRASDELRKSGKTFHYAIVDKNDEYLGTISLKNVDRDNLNAEYAISLRKVAQGQNIAKEATLALFDIAFRQMKLQKVYLNVYAHNQRAIRFYEKMGFLLEGKSLKHIKKDDRFHDLCWFALQREMYIDVQEEA